MMSITGSVLVYRNELYRAATAEPIVSAGPGPRLTDAELTQAALRVYPDFRVVRITRPRNPDQAADVSLSRGNDSKKRLFDVRTGQDLGDSIPLGIVVVSRLLDLHDDLLAGPKGRSVNGAGAVAIVAVALTGLMIWWPGVRTWRYSLTVHRGLGWKRLIWHLHSAVGFWTFAFILIFGLSGIYLCFPEQVQDFADWLQPPTPANAGRRLVDKAIYWLAYLHFGRINGIGIPCHGPGLCDQATKASWALFGLAPAAMFVTGAIMWWNRVLGPRIGIRRSADRAARA